MAVLWVVLSIVLIAPIGYSIGVACQSGTFDLEIFLETVFTELASFTSITRVIGAGYIGYFGKTLLYGQTISGLWMKCTAKILTAENATIKASI